MAVGTYQARPLAVPASWRGAAGLSLLAVSLFFAPLVALTMIGLFYVSTASYGRANLLAGIILLGTALAALNLMKRLESDLANYVAFLSYLDGLAVWDVIGFSLVTIRPSEVLFTLLSYTFASVFGAGGIAYVFFLVFLIYLAVGLAAVGGLRAGLDYYELPVDWPRRAGPAILIAVAMAFYLLVTFSLVGHVVRQYLAGAVLCLALAQYLRGHRSSTLMLLALAPLFHASAVVLVALFAVAVAAKAMGRFASVALLVGAALGVVLFKQAGVAYILQAAPGATQNDGDVPLLLMLMDVGLMTAAIGLVMKSGRLPWSDRFYGLLIFVLLFWTMLAFLQGIDLYFLRFYFYSEFIRIVVVSFVVARCFYLFGWSAAFAVLTAAIGIFLLRFVGNPWDYGGDLLEVMFSSLPAFVERVCQNYQC